MAEPTQLESKLAEVIGLAQASQDTTRKARETKAEATEMMQTYLGDDADALDGLEFMIMAEAGELGHVEIVDKMNEQVRDKAE
jgi:hypothetical protein